MTGPHPPNSGATPLLSNSGAERRMGERNDEFGLVGEGEERGEKPCRPLGTYERFRVQLHDLGFHYNVAFIGTFIVPPLSTNYESAILHAVTAVVRQHANLCLQIRDSSSPVFVCLPHIDVQRVVTFRPLVASSIDARRKALERFLSDENSRSFTDPQLPLWRITCLSEGKAIVAGSRLSICFVYHHVIADGKSGNVVLSDIRDALNLQTSQATYPDGNSLTISPERATLCNEVGPSMEELIPYHVTWRARLRTLFYHYFPCLQRGRGLAMWTGSPYHYSESGPARTMIRLIQLSAPATQRLRRRCQSHNTSITALLQVIVGAVLFAHYPETESLRCATALSLRRFFPPEYGIDETRLGLWIDAFSYIFTRKELQSQDVKPGVDNRLSGEKLWKAAKQSKRRINAEVRKGLNNLSFASMQGKTDFTAGLLGQMGKKRQNSYSITNVGVLEERRQPNGVITAHNDQDQQGSWKLENVLFSQSAHVNGSAVQFCIVSCKAGGMAISMNWQEATVGEMDMDVVRGDLERALERWGMRSE